MNLLIKIKSLFNKQTHNNVTGNTIKNNSDNYNIHQGDVNINITDINKIGLKECRNENLITMLKLINGSSMIIIALHLVLIFYSLGTVKIQQLETLAIIYPTYIMQYYYILSVLLTILYYRYLTSKYKLNHNLSLILNFSILILMVFLHFYTLINGLFNNIYLYTLFPLFCYFIVDKILNKYF